METFTLNTFELDQRAALLKQHGQTLCNLSSKLNFQAALDVKSATDFQRNVQMRNASRRMAKLGTCLINIGHVLTGIVDAVLYEEKVDEEYIIKTLSQVDQLESIVPVGSPSGVSGDSNYWDDTLDFIIKGDYSDKFTGLGFAGSVALGFTPVGFAADARDFVHALTHIKENSFWGNVGTLSLNIIAFIPLVGDLKNVKYVKYADEAGDVLKHVDGAGDIAKGIAKNGDEIIDGMIDAQKHADDVIDASKGMFRSQEFFEDHFGRHAKGLGKLTREEYLKGAQELIHSAPGGNIITKTRPNGDTLFFNKVTEEFAIKTSDGIIRTYYKAKGGIRYFNRQ